MLRACYPLRRLTVCLSSCGTYPITRRFSSSPSIIPTGPPTLGLSNINATHGGSFVSAMLTPPTNLHLTENRAFTHASSLDARLDLFSQLVPTTEKDHAVDLFEKSWAQSPVDTLKLIFHAGSVREGKGDKKSFLHGLWWLSQKHPQTLLANLALVPNTSYWKDLLELLRRLNIGETEFGKGFDRRKKLTWDQFKSKKEGKKERREKYKALLAALPSDAARAAVKEERKKQFDQETKIVMEQARQARKKLAKERLERTGECRKSLTYAQVEDTVAKLFAQQIHKDTQELASTEKRKEISLAGKWAPSFGGSFDKYTDISLSILRKLEDRPISHEELETKSAKVHSTLQNYLTPLRKYIQIPESYMSANKWNELPYNRVPSVAMKTYKEHFLKHDKERFVSYLNKIKNSKSAEKLASGALLPHEILFETLKTRGDPDLATVSELQWRSYVDRLAKAGTLNNIMPVCDVSGSMHSKIGNTGILNIHVSIALSLLISEIAQPPFKNLICTFSATPMFHKVEGENLIERHNNLQGAEWGMNTNYQAVFDLILAQARLHKLTDEQMIKRIVVLSDMEFDASTTNNAYLTDHMLAEQKFKNAGYTLPEIVYWNLAARHNPASVPVTKDTPGVSLISGFSGNLLKLFMEDPEATVDSATKPTSDQPTSDQPVKKRMTPLDIMEKALSNKLFENLKVVD